MTRGAKDRAGVGPVPKRRLHETLRRMVRIGLFEERASILIMESKLPGLSHSCIGEETEVVGACIDVRDYMAGNHRSHGHAIGRRVTLAPLLAKLVVKKVGMCRGHTGSMYLAAFADSLCSDRRLFDACCRYILEGAPAGAWVKVCLCLRRRYRRLRSYSRVVERGDHIGSSRFLLCENNGHGSTHRTCRRLPLLTSHILTSALQPEEGRETFKLTSETSQLENTYG